MTALLYVFGLVVFLIAILASIGLHEFGHMIPAKRFGGKVTQWFVGFGPTVWSRKIGETEYGVKAVPLGGYVKIVGMLPPDPKAPVPAAGESGEVTVRGSSTGLFTQLISDARQAEWEHVKPEDEPRLFYKMAWWKKVVVMAGGPMVNLLIAFVCFQAVYATYGNPEDHKIGTTIDEVLDCVVPYAEAERKCEPGDPVTPAKKAGLEAGDRFVAVNGVPASFWEAVQAQIRGNADGVVTITYERDGVETTVETNTTVTARPASDDPYEERIEDVGFLGVVPTDLGPRTGGPLYTLEDMGAKTVKVVEAMADLPVKVWGVARAIVGVQEREPDSPVSIVGGGRISGEVAAHDEIPATEKVVFLVMLIGGFNFFIGMFNFIPLLPLDGGHIAGAIYEALRRGLARLRRRPDPGYVDVAKMLPVAYVVASAILVLGLVLIVGDIVVPLHLPS